MTDEIDWNMPALWLKGRVRLGNRHRGDWTFATTPDGYVGVYQGHVMINEYNEARQKWIMRSIEKHRFAVLPEHQLPRFRK